MNETTTYRRAKGWQLALAVMSQVVPTALVIMMTFASYVATGVYGATAILAGGILTGTRIFDAITDPVCGFLVDRLNTRFGRVRPLMLIGWALTSLSILLMFVVCPGKNNVISFILIYILYIIGYTIFNTGDGMVSSVITNDPTQRPMVGRWASVFKSIFSGTFSMILAATLMPKHNNEYGLPLFKDLAFLIIAITGVLTLMAIIALTASGHDTEETFKGTTHKPINIKEMFGMLKNSRELQMFTVAAASDKLAMTTASQSAINVMIFGICIGNYRFSGSISLWMTAVTVIMLFLTSGFAKRNGTKKTLVQWTWISLIIYGIMFVFMLMVNTLDITKVTILTVGFIVIRCMMNASQMIVSSCTQPMIADITDYNLSQTGHFSPSVVAMTYSFVDKLISSLASTIVGVAVSMIGYVNSMPQVQDPFSNSILMTALFLWLGMPMLGYVCTLIAMKFYKLDQNTMLEVEKKNAEIQGL